MWIEIEHRLRFEYDGFISESRLELRVEPRVTEHQNLHSFLLAVGPPTRVHRYRDWLGNQVHHFGIADFHQAIRVTARSLLETRSHAVLDAAVEPPVTGPALGELLDFTTFGGPVLRSARLEEFARGLAVGPDAGLADQVRAVGAAVHERCQYVTGVSDYRSTSEHLLESGTGVCQDFAHLALALLRLRGIPCRYVSGYLHLDGEEPSQSHAWIEAHAPGRGWFGYDPTHAREPGERYVVVGYGRDYDDVPPNRGIYRGDAKEVLEAEVHTRESAPRDVAGLHEETASIDVPVFREVPPRFDAGEDAEPVSDEQQQQQQQ